MIPVQRLIFLQYILFSMFDKSNILSLIHSRIKNTKILHSHIYHSSIFANKLLEIIKTLKMFRTTSL